MADLRTGAAQSKLPYYHVSERPTYALLIPRSQSNTNSEHNLNLTYRVTECVFHEYTHVNMCKRMAAIGIT